jgi:NNP family nitrate/nitrite transporter-like MFS transporter
MDDNHNSQDNPTRNLGGTKGKDEEEASLQSQNSAGQHVEVSDGADVSGVKQAYVDAINHSRARRSIDLLSNTSTRRYGSESDNNVLDFGRHTEENVIEDAEHYHTQPAATLLSNSVLRNDPVISKSGGRKYEVESSDIISDISSSSVEDEEEHEEEEDHDDAVDRTLEDQIIDLSRPDISGADLICNRLRMDRHVTRTDVENRLAMSSRFGNVGGIQSAYHRQPLTSTRNYGFSAMYEDATSRRSGSSGGSTPWNSRGVHDPRRPSSRHSSECTSNMSPYYEHTGGWLRLRPQNANIESRLPSHRRSYSSSSQQSPIRYDHHDNFVEILGTTDEEDATNLEAVDQKTLYQEEPTGSIHDFEDTGQGLEQDPGSAFDDVDAPTDFGHGERASGEENHPRSDQNDSSAQNNNEEMPPLRNVASVQRSISNSIDTQWASPDSKFERYACRVDHHQGDRAIEIPLVVFERPHMRAFHFAWMSFFVAFFTWFAISPLLPEIKNSLGLSHREIFMSNVFGSAGTVICRIIVGPLCDRFGARWVMATTLIISSIPVMATGLVNTATELYILRLITGIAGSSFVTCQYWTSSMFSREIAGTANSIAAGWGNLGGGVTNIVMGSALFPMFKVIYGGNGETEEFAADRAWRIVCIVPAILSFAMAFIILKYSDDSPKGNYMKLKRLGLMPKIEAMNALREASHDYNTWILFIHYGCCFGVEVTMTAGAALYFADEFKQSTESAAALASIFGWLNLFARGLGGFISDIMNVNGGMRGRCFWHALTLVLEGVFVIAFGYVRTLGSAIAIMVLFSLFVQCAEVSLSFSCVGSKTVQSWTFLLILDSCSYYKPPLPQGSTYSIVPYVCPKVTGSVAGLVGAGGNLGGVAFLLMIQVWNYRPAFKFMGICVICSSVLTFFIKLKGHSGFFCCYDAPEVLQKRGSIVGNISCSSGGINSEAETPRRNGQGVVASTGIDNNEPL